MAKRSRKRIHGGRSAPSRTEQHRSTRLRIVGGHLRGRPITFSGDPAVRPMKDRTRQAVFNILGPLREPIIALDFFAGTGVLGLEAISRGARSAVLIERNRQEARTIQANVERLGLANRVKVVCGDAFHWLSEDRLPRDMPFVAFVCPPYRLYQQRADEMDLMVHRLVEYALEGSMIVLEADKSFDVARLPDPETWRCRSYPPATVGFRFF